MTQVAYSPYAYKAPAPPSSPPCIAPPPDMKVTPRPDAALAPQIWKDTFQAPATEKLIADFHCSMLDYKNGVFEAHVFISVNYVAIKPINPPTAQKKLQHFIIGMGQIASWSRASKIMTDSQPFVKIKTVKPGQLADSIHIYGTDLRLHLLFDFVQMSYERFCYTFDTSWRSSPAGAAAAAASLAASMRATNPNLNNPMALNFTAVGPGLPLGGTTNMFNAFPPPQRAPSGLALGNPPPPLNNNNNNNNNLPFVRPLSGTGLISPLNFPTNPLIMSPPSGMAPMIPPPPPPNNQQQQQQQYYNNNNNNQQQHQHYHQQQQQAAEHDNNAAETDSVPVLSHNTPPQQQQQQKEQQEEVWSRLGSK
jgi:hypothetical protein